MRREPWLTRFWEELTPAQRRRIQSRIRRQQPPPAQSTEEAARHWDGLGLPERTELLYGRPSGSDSPAT